ncbi:MAG: hypothetical protein L0154_01850 [Chloroflexi bacterium]|nr:hypothetical protein [Chloroflexota bacterium]
MRKFSILFSILVLVTTAIFIPAVSAQTDVSPGCDDLANDFTLGSYTGDFFANESITFVVNGTMAAGDNYDISVDGTVVSAGETGTTYTHTFLADVTGAVITVTVNQGTFTVSVSCDQTGDDDEGGDFTLCHYPPGNPEAAHTITVGSQNAFDTHMDRHGDSPGACPPGVQSRTDDIGLGLAIFILPKMGVVSIYGECEEGGCSPIIEFHTADVVALIGVLVVSEDSFETFDTDLTDEWEVRIFYLGNQDRDGDGTFHDVFQMNIYFNDVLAYDDLLILVAVDGTVSWELNDDLGVDITFLFDDEDDTCDADGPDDIPGNEDDEVCEGA